MRWAIAKKKSASGNDEYHFKQVKSKEWLSSHHKRLKKRKAAWLIIATELGHVSIVISLRSIDSQ